MPETSSWPPCQQKQDDLSQWRAYGGSGPHFLIGFDARRLERKANLWAFKLDKVLYQKKLITAELGRALDARIQSIVDGLRSAGEQEVEAQKIHEWGADIVYALLEMLPRYKHHTFEAESEWRLIRRQPVIPQQPVLPIEFRLSGSLIVPYMSLPLHSRVRDAEVSRGVTDTAIVKILIGPSPHPDELRYAVREMISYVNFAASIECSAVPFRTGRTNTQIEAV